MTVYVYVDYDHNDIEVFYKLEDAKAKAQKEWSDVEGQEYSTANSWCWGEYVTVYQREIK
jgi:hypothetical protein